MKHKWLSNLALLAFESKYTANVNVDKFLINTKKESKLELC